MSVAATDTFAVDLVEAIHDQVRAVYRRFAQDPPSPADFARALDRVRHHAESSAQVRALAAAGRLHELIDARPFNLEMDLLNKCNLRCVMCMMSHRSVIEQPLERFPLVRFERLAEEVFWHVNALSFTYGTEPLLHPQFARFVEVAGRYRIPRVYAVTNGLLLTEDIARAAVTNGMHALTVSVDAARRETYERIRVGGDWEKLMHNLRMLQRIRREMGAKGPRLELAFVMMRSNIRELPAFVDLAASLGASSVSAIHMLPFELLNSVGESCSLVKETTNDMIRQARARARQHGLEFPSPPLFGESVGRDPGAAGVDRFGLPVSSAVRAAGHCPFPWHFVALDMHGDVIPCGWWQGGVAMGNIHKESFEAIWNNEAYQRLRAEHKRGELCPTCRRCPAAGVGSVDDASAFAPR